jgi:hypothetical protein
MACGAIGTPLLAGTPPLAPPNRSLSRRAAGSLRYVLIAGMLAVGLVIGIAAILVVREAGRIANEPPPALFDPDDAFDFVVEELPDDVAATLTPADVRRILDFEVEFLQERGAGGNGGAGGLTGPVVFGGPETTAYILERASETGEAYLAEQVDAVLETQLRYLRAIGAVGPADVAPGEIGDESPSG